MKSGIGETIKEGDRLLTIMPSGADYAVEVFINPMDMPLVAKGQNMQFIFDGWPSMVFSGWPNLSYGTFSGTIMAIDQFANKDGKYRLLVAPNPKSKSWPKALRVGSGAKGILLLKEVPIWYEMWRQLNSFLLIFTKPKLLRKTNNMKLITILICTLLFLGNHCQAQDSIFTPTQLFWYMEQFHPMIQKANLKTDVGEANLLKAKGGFDPKIESDYSNKAYENQDYYRYFNSGLKVPTWFGLTGKAGWNQSDGKYINPELRTPNSGLFQAGLEWEVGKGLFIDERRKTLRQAKAFTDLTEAQRLIELNELYFNAIKSYWNWFIAYSQLKTFESAMTLAKERLVNVRKRVAIGEEAAIDTLEASLQLQSRQIQKNELSANFEKAKLELSAFLWFEDLQPLEVQDNLKPISLDSAFVGETEPLSLFDTDSIWLSHPKIQFYDAKIEALTLESRWKKEQLKPKLTLGYNLLNEPVNFNPVDQFSADNYKLGIEFSMPLFLRKERGALQLARLKTQEESLNRQFSVQGLQISWSTALVDYQMLGQQVELYKTAATSYKTLLDGEWSKFTNGESSLFIINQRELYFLDAQIKWIQVMGKREVSRAKLLYSQGKMPAFIEQKLGGR